MKPMDKERREYLKKYKKEHLKRISFEMEITKYQRLLNHISTTGESVNGFIKRAVESQIRSDAFHCSDKAEEYERTMELIRQLGELILSTQPKEKTDDGVWGK